MKSSILIILICIYSNLYSQNSIYLVNHKVEYHYYVNYKLIHDTLNLNVTLQIFNHDSSIFYLPFYKSSQTCIKDYLITSKPQINVKEYCCGLMEFDMHNEPNQFQYFYDSLIAISPKTVFILNKEFKFLVTKRIADVNVKFNDVLHYPHDTLTNTNFKIALESEIFRFPINKNKPFLKFYTRIKCRIKNRKSRFKIYCYDNETCSPSIVSLI